MSANATQANTVWKADFSDGFSAGAADSKWFYFSAGPFVGDDGVISTTESGLKVVASGTNAETGKPAFVRTSGPESGMPGEFDHIKWLAYVNHLSSAGVPGFDTVAGKKLTVEAVLNVQTYGVNDHPFGDAVQDGDSDYRLAACSFNTVDLQTNMTFDFFITNSMIWVLYERLPFGREALGNYAAFTYVIPVMERSADDVHRYAVSYDKDSNTVTWLVDGTEVFSVQNPGRRIDRKYMAIDLGGEETVVTLGQLDGGLGMFTMLDCTQPTGKALVNLTNHIPNWNFDPAKGEPVALSCVDNESLASNRLFGQGSEFTVEEFAISYT